MFYNINIMRNCRSRLQEFYKQISAPTFKADALESTKIKMYVHLYDMVMMMRELQIVMENTRNLKGQYDFLTSNVERIVKADNVDAVVTNLINILTLFPVELLDEYDEDLSMYSMHDDAFRIYNRSNNNDSYSFRDYFSLANIIDNSISCNQRPISVFIPNCQDAKMALDIKRMNPEKEYVIYGNEAEQEYLKTAKERMHKAVKGELKGSRIKNSAFDILYLQPTFKYKIGRDEKLIAIKKPEKEAIQDCLKYLKNEGVMIVALPITRLFKDTCVMLSKYLKDIQIFKSDVYNNTGIVYIIGQKDVSRVIDEQAYATLRGMYSNTPEEFDAFFSEKKVYKLDSRFIEIDLFKGSALDFEEMRNFVDNTGLNNKMLEEQMTDKLSDQAKNPLLPFNIGQLGLVLTSGCLDGVVEEGDGHCHLIKGRVAKKIISEEVETGPNKIELTETSINKVEINVLMPDGTFKTLA